jgi:hypothetical protein
MSEIASGLQNLYSHSKSAIVTQYGTLRTLRCGRQDLARVLQIESLLPKSSPNLQTEFIPQDLDIKLGHLLWAEIFENDSCLFSPGHCP